MAPTIFVALMWIISSVVMTFFIHWLYQTHSRALTEDVTSILHAEAMQTALWQLQAEVTNADGKPPAEIQKDVQTIDDVSAEFSWSRT